MRHRPSFKNLPKIQAKRFKKLRAAAERVRLLAGTVRAKSRRRRGA
jgi:hypothetical protein